MMPTYKIPLWLPSQIGNQAPFDHALARLEFQLREAQAHEALGTLRRSLQMRATFYDTKDRWARGQKQNTRSKNAINSAQARINVARDEYRVARAALVNLSKLLSQPMDESLHVLNDSDIRSMKTTETDRDSAGRVFTLSKALRSLEDEDIRPVHETAPGTVGLTGETRKTLSWIWRGGKITGAEEDSYYDEEIRVEWAKSRSRVARYREEIRIVEEEMNRTLRFWNWKADQWTKLASIQDTRTLDSSVQDGMQAYARRQADMCRRLKVSFESQWAGTSEIISKSQKLAENPDAWYKMKEKEEEELEAAKLRRLASRALGQK
ncbi:hypothetical protein EST38_g12692 [Candolleomyces aberdarensis]|uniref:Uncharacterized protein n=1 Tax=Candolleomyces aberdarensis TaxID=2316362 RepID=A0A4Q2D4A5_9AGAR|nr:hypothetical protein EST38_g12692 [Candolleomyces aberdarensis]